MRELHYARTIIAACLIVGCEQPSAADAQRVGQRTAEHRTAVLLRPNLTLPAGASVVPESGQLVMNAVPSIWRSYVDAQRVLHVDEVIRYDAQWRGLRRYEFDSSGTLKFFAERQHGPARNMDDVHDLGQGWIAFAGGMPVLLSRVTPDGGAWPYSSQELRSIVTRAYMLLDSAIVSAK